VTLTDEERRSLERLLHKRLLDDCAECEKIGYRPSGFRRMIGESGATGDAIVDCLSDGLLPKDRADELCMIIMIWLDPRCATDKNLNKHDLYRTNYEATKLAIARAMKGEPTANELIANRKTIRHYALEGMFED